MHVLLVEDRNLEKTESLFANLEAQGHFVGLAHTPETAAQKTASLWPNLVVFNVPQGTPDLYDCRQAIGKTKLDVPHLVISHNKQLAEPEQNLIVIASRDPNKLNQSIAEAVIIQKDRFFRLADLVIDLQQRNVLRNGQQFSLTPKEFKLLRLLVEHPNQVLSRKVIMQEVWETDYMGDTRTLDVHVRWLREKIEENPSRPEHLVTIRGVGYRFITEPETD